MSATRSCSEGLRLFTRNPANPILTKETLPYPAYGIFNPAATMLNGETILLARVEDMRGLSHLALCRSKDGVSGWEIDAAPALEPDPIKYPEEQWGIEDPRITWLEEREEYAVVYITYSRRGPQVSLATTKDFKTFDRWGSIIPPEHKDPALFSKRFRGRLAMLHRPVTEGQESNMWISFSADLGHWGDHRLLIEARPGPWWDAYRVGVCPPPLETTEGWLVLYHGVRRSQTGTKLFHLGLALLDLEDPRRVIRRGEEWVFGAQAPYEREGNVRDVVFPCGWIHDAATGKLRLYYGASSTSVCLAEADLKEVLSYVLSCPQPV